MMLLHIKYKAFFVIRTLIISLALLQSNAKVILVKIGGSSITNKAHKESLNKDALDWFAQTISNGIHFMNNDNYCNSTNNNNDQCQEKTNESSLLVSNSYIIIHGAGSFGHHTAKEYGLKGQSTKPKNSNNNNNSTTNNNLIDDYFKLQGLAKTRLSVQTLNNLVVQSFIKHDIPAIGISPCFGIPYMQAHGGDENGAITMLRQVLSDTIHAGFIPVLHGDACLYGTNDVGILSGDVIMQVLGTNTTTSTTKILNDNFITIDQVIFITDVDGVYTQDPRHDPNAQLLRYIAIDPKTGSIIQSSTQKTIIHASGSSHEHDVTGGLETKLKSAATIASSGTNVTIVKVGSTSAEQALRGLTDFERGTIIYAQDSDS